jgi:hypothetical protein
LEARVAWTALVAVEATVTQVVVVVVVVAEA